MSIGAAMLLWGVKASFLSYISRSGGSVALSEPAIYQGGILGFPGTDSGEMDETYSFAGGARFVAHGGLLDVRLESPSVTWGDTASLSVVTPGMEGPTRLVIAELHATEATVATGELVWRATLSEDGAQLFGSTYPVGTELDPVLILEHGPGPG